MAYIGRPPEYGGYEKQVLTADGSTTTFVLDYTVGTESSLFVSVAGIPQQPGVAYTLSGGGANIIFSVAPASTATVFVIFLGYAYDAGTLLGTGAITGQTELTTGVQGAVTLLIYDDSASGLRKLNLDNFIIGQTELATTAADDDVLLIYDLSATEVKKIQKSNIAASLTYNTRTATGDGTTTTVTVTSGVTVDNCLVFLNGICQAPTTDYTVSSTTLTFTTAPATGNAIVIRELPR